MSMYWLWLALCLSLAYRKIFVQQKLTMLQQQHAYAIEPAMCIYVATFGAIGVAWSNPSS